MLEKEVIFHPTKLARTYSGILLYSIDEKSCNHQESVYESIGLKCPDQANLYREKTGMRSIGPIAKELRFPQLVMKTFLSWANQGWCS